MANYYIDLNCGSDENDGLCADKPSHNHRQSRWLAQPYKGNGTGRAESPLKKSDICKFALQSQMRQQLLFASLV